MDTATPDLHSLAARVERLERQNRLFKRGGLALLLSAATLIVMAQARPAPARTVEAQSFVLRDANGNKRADLAMPARVPVLRFFDEKGAGTAEVSATGYSIFGTKTMTLGTGQQSTQIPVARMNLFPEGLFFSDADGKIVILLGGIESPGTTLNARALTFFSADGAADLEVAKEGTSLKLSDSHGFTTTIGNVGLVTPSTGESHQTSAASIRMFNEKGDVIWEAPTQ